MNACTFHRLAFGQPDPQCRKCRMFVPREPCHRVDRLEGLACDRPRGHDGSHMAIGKGWGVSWSEEVTPTR